MTRDKQLIGIREVCIKVNPGLKPASAPKNDSQAHTVRPIRLADVLLAMKTKYVDKGYIFGVPAWIKHGGELLFGSYLWNLREDSLDKQSDETIDFIFNLLTP